MDWTIEYLEKDGIVTAKTSGVMDWDEHKRFAGELYPSASKYGVRKILIDFREMLPKFTILQIDELPNILMEVGVWPGFKIASVHNPNILNSRKFKLFNKVTNLLSIKVKQFEDPDEALDWLKAT